MRRDTSGNLGGHGKRLRTGEAPAFAMQRPKADTEAGELVETPVPRAAPGIFRCRRYLLASSSLDVALVLTGIRIFMPLRTIT
jgi:hypothetical protein